MRRPLHYLLLQLAPVTHKPQHSHESSGPQDHHPSFYLSIPASIHLNTALYNPLCLSLHIPMSHSFKITHQHHHLPQARTRYKECASANAPPGKLLEIRAQFPPQSDTLLFISTHLAIDLPLDSICLYPLYLPPVNLSPPTREAVG